MTKKYILKSGNVTMTADKIKITQKGFIDLYVKSEFIGFIEAKKLQIYKKGIQEGPAGKIKTFSLIIKEV